MLSLIINELYFFYEDAVGFVEPEAEVITGYRDGDGVAQGGYLLYHYFFAGNTAHFHELDKDIVFLERMYNRLLTYF